MPATLADIQRKYGDSVYPLYKDQMHEPYMENDNGIGYKGVVMYDENEDKVQCAECGKWFKNLGQHIRMDHKVKAREYKSSFGLYQKTPLCTPTESRRLSKIAIRMVENRNPEEFKQHVKSAIKKAYSKNRKLALEGKSNGKHSAVQEKNERGLCDAQIAARLIIVRERSGKTEVTSSDVSKYDNRLYKVIFYRYGSIELACKALGINFSKLKKYEDALLLGLLREYVEQNCNIPSSVDIEREYNIPRSTFHRYFGSWERAKIMAGLDQLLEDVKNE